MTTFGSRLRQWRESCGLKRSDLADRLGISVRTVARYESDERSPEKEEFAKLVASGADVIWLLTGSKNGPIAMTQSQTMSAPVVTLPLYNAQLSAGRGLAGPDNEESDDLKVPEEFVRNVLRRSPRGLVVARADGHSMAPTIASGDLLIIDTADQRLQNGRIYALSVADSLLVKRISRSIKGKVQLVSDNREYETEQLPDAEDDVDIRIIGQVIWHGGSLE